MITVVLVLVVAAFICALAAAATGKMPLWVSVVFLCIIELLRSLPVRAVLPLVLATSLLLASCSHCLEEQHRNDLACWLKDEIISCSEDAIVPEVTPLIIALLPAITGAGGVDWSKIESQLLSMGIRDGGCLLAALEQRFSQPQASPGLRAEAPAVADLRHRLWPRTGYKMADGTVLR